MKILSNVAKFKEAKNKEIFTALSYLHYAQGQEKYTNYLHVIHWDFFFKNVTLKSKLVYRKDIVDFRDRKLIFVKISMNIMTTTRDMTELKTYSPQIFKFIS